MAGEDSPPPPPPPQLTTKLKKNKAIISRNLCVLNIVSSFFDNRAEDKKTF